MIILFQKSTSNQPGVVYSIRQIKKLSQLKIKVIDLTCIKKSTKLLIRCCLVFNSRKTISLIYKILKLFIVLRKFLGHVPF